MGGVVGVDTIRLRLPVVSRAAIYPTVLPCGASAGVRYGEGWVEGSVARLQHGVNFPSLPVGDLRRVVRGLVVDATSVVPLLPTGWHLEDLEIARIDVVRDFTEVPEPTFVLTGFHSGRVFGPAAMSGFSRRRAVTNSLRVGPESSWLARIYVKDEKPRASAPPGTLRFEAQFRPSRLRSAWAANHGGAIVRLRDVDESTLERLARATFEHVGFNCVELSPR